MNMIRKGQIRRLAKGDVVGQIRLIHQYYGIAARRAGRRGHQPPSPFASAMRR